MGLVCFGAFCFKLKLFSVSPLFFSLVFSYTFWTNLEIGAFTYREEVNVEERNGMASLC